MLAGLSRFSPWGAAGAGGGSMGPPDDGILAACFFTLSGSTVTLQDQKNVASITRRAAGIYTVTFAAALAHNNYGVLARGRLPDSTTDRAALVKPRRNTSGGNNRYSTTDVDIQVAMAAVETPIEAGNVGVIVFDPAELDSAAYLAAAHFTVSGTTPTIQKQKNVASAARASAGLHTIGFTSSLADADYSAFTDGRYPDFSSNSIPVSGGGRNTTGPLNRHTTSTFDMICGQLPSSATLFDVVRGSLLVKKADTIPGGTLAHVRFSVSGGVVTIVSSYNVSSVTRHATGVFRVNFTNALSDANYAVIGDGKYSNDTNNDAPTVSACRNSSSSRNVYSTSAVDVTVDGIGASTFDPDTCDIWIVKPSLM